VAQDDPFQQKGNRNEGGDAPDDKAVLSARQKKAAPHEDAGPQDKEFHEQPGPEGPHLVADDVRTPQHRPLRFVLRKPNGPAQKLDRKDDADGRGGAQ